MAGIGPAVRDAGSAESGQLKESQSMLKIIVAAAVAVSFANLDVADAASKKKRKKVRAPAPISYVPAAPVSRRTPGPPWAGPGECYTDEGYGRYSPCGEGKDM